MLKKTKLKFVKSFFLNTLYICDRRIRTAFEKYDAGSIQPSRRGFSPLIKHNAIDPDREILVINHIMQFKTVESHYVRRKATYEYLPPELSVSKMYVMYVKWCSENDPPKKAEKEDFYRRTFKTKFKLKFHMVKKDLCDTA